MQSFKSADAPGHTLPAELHTTPTASIAVTRSPKDYGGFRFTRVTCCTDKNKIWCVEAYHRCALKYTKFYLDYYMGMGLWPPKQ